MKQSTLLRWIETAESARFCRLAEEASAECSYFSVLFQSLRCCRVLATHKTTPENALDLNVFRWTPLNAVPGRPPTADLLVGPCAPPRRGRHGTAWLRQKAADQSTESGSPTEDNPAIIAWAGWPVTLNAVRACRG
jgi:hypothetical protein